MQDFDVFIKITTDPGFGDPITEYPISESLSSLSSSEDGVDLWIYKEWTSGESLEEDTQPPVPQMTYGNMKPASAAASSRGPIEWIEERDWWIPPRKTTPRPVSTPSTTTTTTYRPPVTYPPVTNPPDEEDPWDAFCRLPQNMNKRFCRDHRIPL